MNQLHNFEGVCVYSGLLIIPLAEMSHSHTTVARMHSFSGTHARRPRASLLGGYVIIGALKRDHSPKIP